MSISLDLFLQNELNMKKVSFIINFFEKINLNSLCSSETVSESTKLNIYKIYSSEPPKTSFESFLKSKGILSALNEWVSLKKGSYFYKTPSFSAIDWFKERITSCTILDLCTDNSLYSAYPNNFEFINVVYNLLSLL